MNWKRPAQAEFAIQHLDQVGQLLLTTTMKPSMGQLKLKEQRKQPK